MESQFFVKKKFKRLKLSYMFDLVCMGDGFCGEISNKRKSTVVSLTKQITMKMKRTDKAWPVLH